VFPELLTASSEHFEREGVYLLENGLDLFVWVGRNVALDFLQKVFNVPSYDALMSGKVSFFWEVIKK
jgi:protein transport protein SEC24